jgi:hypothetical protein
MVDERMLRAGEVPGLGAAGMRMAVLPDVGVNFQVGAGLGAVWSWVCASTSHQSSPNSREASIIPEDSQVPRGCSNTPLS